MREKHIMWAPNISGRKVVGKREPGVPPGRILIWALLLVSPHKQVTAVMSKTAFILLSCCLGILQYGSPAHIQNVDI